MNNQAIYSLPKGKKLVKVDNDPPTWIEVFKNISKEDLDKKIQDYKDHINKEKEELKSHSKTLTRDYKKPSDKRSCGVDEIPLTQILFNSSHC